MVNVGPVPVGTAPPAHTLRLKGVEETPPADMVAPDPPSLKSREALDGLAGQAPEAIPAPETDAEAVSMPVPVFSSQK